MSNPRSGLLESIRKIFTPSNAAPGPRGGFQVAKSDEEWRCELGAEQYRVLRKHGTESPGTSPLLKERGRGMFHCAGCGESVYGSDAKFDSGTGWPSFTSAVEGGVETETDTSFFMKRTEVHCRRCGGHLGHVFDDGPGPAGMRHCINGAALTFDPE